MNDSKPTCTNCGAPLDERARNFCEHCGAELHATPPPLASPPPLHGTVPSPLTPPQPSPPPPPLPQRATPPPPPSHAAPPAQPPPPLDRAQRGRYVPDAVPPPAPKLDAPETGQFSDSGGAAMKALLVSLSVALIPCCGIGIVLLLVYLWFAGARAVPR